ncbi:tetratricopeptide repeat-containing sulfotransferase family protein [Sphingomonas sp. URHD0057]|uniref:tetratricopeptide repeat-containing sulfotransferase family protein n=1 Tax=Sphingomonas sp. URHD0057 TaxID=1380389 RepID=UPI00055CC6B8|nr:sulfotransferase [Sphingomonas sp. URHD0057]
MTDKVEVQAGTLEEGLANGYALLDPHPEAALMQAQTLLKLGSDARVFRLAASAHRRLDQAREAEAAELAAIEHSLTVPELKAAAGAEHEGRSAEAAAATAAWLERHPDDLLAMTISAEAAISMKLLGEGEQLLRRVLERAPGFLRASMFLARGLMLQCRIGEAIEVMTRAVARAPDNLSANKFLAQLQAEARDYEGAAATYERLLGRHDKEAELWVSYGDMLRFLGRRTDSELAYRRAIFCDGGYGAGWWGLASLDANALADKDVARMEAALVERRDKPEDVGALHFSLGEAFDKRGRYEEAFEEFAAGNALRRKAQPYDPASLTDEISRSIEFFTRHRLEAQTSAAGDAGPIFIVGMPRSGSTLIERILGGHPEIEATGELPIIPRIVEVLSARGGGVGGFRDVVAKIDHAGLRRLGGTYLERSPEYRKSDKPRFTDKLHMNWRHIGFLRMILPGAKMIDVRRDALDCCWSNFKLLFTRGHPAASDLDHIGRFYRDYVRMMDHMDAVAPGAVLRVGYEDVIDDAEREARRIFSFLGVEFNAQSLDFHTSAEPVATASSEQVRRPLNRSGIGTWRPYAQWLAPLREALGPLADA